MSARKRRILVSYISGWRVRQPYGFNRDWRLLLLREPCVYCGGPASGLDHIESAYRGGANAWKNRAPACTWCDSRKGSRTLLLFLLERRALELRAS